MITWHGLIDLLIPPNCTVDYYEKVMAADPGVQDYYRFFEAPGAGHYFGGIGPLPNDALGSLIKWVEEDVAQGTLAATSTPINGVARHRPLCPYPLVAAYKGGDSNQASSFECAASFAIGDSISSDRGYMKSAQMPIPNRELDDQRENLLLLQSICFLG